MEPTIEPVKFNQDVLKQIIEINLLIAEMNIEIVKMLSVPAYLLETPLIGKAETERIRQVAEMYGGPVAPITPDELTKHSSKDTPW